MAMLPPYMHATIQWLVSGTSHIITTPLIYTGLHLPALLPSQRWWLLPLLIIDLGPLWGFPAPATCMQPSCIYMNLRPDACYPLVPCRAQPVSRHPVHRHACCTSTHAACTANCQPVHAPAVRPLLPQRCSSGTNAHYTAVLPVFTTRTGGAYGAFYSSTACQLSSLLRALSHSRLVLPRPCRRFHHDRSPRAYRLFSKHIILTLR